MSAENIVMLIIFGVVIVPVFIAGLFLLKGKGAFLIAGYNTMSRGEKDHFDEKALCRFAGKLVLAVSAGSVLIPVSVLLENVRLSYCGVAVVVIVTVGGVVYVNTGKRFHRAESGDESRKTGK